MGISKTGDPKDLPRFKPGDVVQLDPNCVERDNSEVSEHFNKVFIVKSVTYDSSIEQFVKLLFAPVELQKRNASSRYKLVEVD